MEAKVLDHEPHQALFVPDEDPLLFYRAIAEFGLTHLHPQGLLFFEINEAFRPGNDSPAEPIWLPEYRITKRFLWQRTNGEKVQNRHKQEIGIINIG